MRSAELAAAAGVTVRTLRHYHQLGILPEPERLPNGYRHYTVDHLVHLLAVRQLADSGVPLGDICSVLSEKPAELPVLLRRLTVQIDEKISLLSEQRNSLLNLSAHVGPPGMPAELRALYPGAQGDAPSSRKGAGYRIFMLLRQGLDTSTYQQVVWLLRMAASPRFRSRVVEIGQQFEGLADLASPLEVEQLVELSRPLLKAYLERPHPGTEERVQDTAAGRILTELLKSGLNRGQRLYLARMISLATPSLATGAKTGEDLETQR